MTRYIITVLLLSLIGLNLNGTALAGEVHEVITLKYKFQPEEITIKVGDTVRWINKEKRAYHNVWFRELGEKPVGEFFPDETFEKTFDKPGTYPYVCEPHETERDMIGVVHVVE